MSRNPAAGEWRLYPAKYFGASPTYDNWCKVSAADILALREERGFEGQNVLFHINHPIRFVYIVGPVISISNYTKVWVITLDDGSGACIDLKVTRLSPQTTNEHIFSTEAKDVLIHSRVGYSAVHVDGKELEVGTILRAKGTFTSYRSVRQIELKRVSIVKNTSDEVEAWNSAAKFRRDILAVPWVLSEQERMAIDKRFAAEERAQKQEEHRTRRKKHLDAQKRGELKEKIEQRRQAAEREMNAGAIV